MLRFYWKLGKDLHDKKNEFSYGKSFYKTISGDLRRLLPEVKSFSETNLKYMQYFYELYPTVPNRPQLGDDLKEDAKIGIFTIPWGHHKLIIDKCKNNADKAMFFVNQVT